MNKADEIRDLLVAEMPSKKVIEPETAEPELDASSSPDEPVDAVDENLDTSAEPDAPEGEEDDPDIVTIKSLAADLEIEPSQLYGMRIPVDGHDPLTISELKDLAQGSMDKREEVKQRETELADTRQALEQQQQQLAAQSDGIAPDELIKAYADITRVEQEFAAIDWTKAEAMNPGEASLKRQKLNEAYQIATYNKQQIEVRMETTRTEIQSQRDQASQSQRDRAMETLHNLVPEWRDSTVFTKDREHMVNTLVEAGVDEADLRGLDSPTLINYLYRSTLRDQKIRKAKPINKPPKVLKAAAVREAGVGKKKADERYFKHAAKSKDARVKNDAMTRVIAEAMRG